MRIARARLVAALLGLCLCASTASGQALAPIGPAGAGGGGAPKGGGTDFGGPRLPSGPLGLDNGPATGGDNGGLPAVQAPHDPDLIVVVFRPGTPDSTSSDFARGLKLTIVNQFDLAGLRLRVFLMRLPKGGDLQRTLQQGAAAGQALWLQPDFNFQSLDGGTTQGGTTQGGTAQVAGPYALHKIHADALPQALRGQGVTVAMVDSGVAKDHESLHADNVTLVDLMGDSGAQPPAEVHGTAIASIIAGSGRVTGVAPGVSLLAIRAFTEVDPTSGASTSDSFHIGQGVSLALDRKAKVINLSIGGPNDPLVRMAVEQAVLSGVIVVAAAGNSGPDAPPVYPGAQAGVLAVTATDDKDRIYSSANRGDYIAVAAPGVNVFCARPGKAAGASAYDYFTGTSMATGYVTGLAAVLLSADPRLTSADIRRILEASATDLGAPKKDPEFGYGRIDAAAAYSTMHTVGAAN